MPSTQVKKRIVVLISGRGSNLDAFVRYTQKPDCAYEISAVISNRPEALGLHLAQEKGIQTRAIDHTQFETREHFDQALSEIIDGFSPDFVILAGFMRILTPEFTLKYQGRMLNIHPSLLPLYPGLNTHQRAIEAKDKHHGATVHFVTPTLDDGPLIIQSQVEIEPSDTAETLASKVLNTEHVIYPLAVQWLAAGQLKMQGDQILITDKTEHFLTSPVLYSKTRFTGPDLLCGISLNLD